MKAPWSQVPALPVTVGLALGIVAADILGAGTIATAAFMVLTLIAVILRRNYAALLTFAIAAGIAVCNWQRPAAAPAALDGRKCTAYVTVQKVVEGENSMRYVTQVDSVRLDNARAAQAADFRMLVTSHSIADKYRPGDRLRCASKIATVKPSDTTIEGRADYNSYLFLDGITARMNVSHGDMTRTGNKSSVWQTLAYDGQMWLRDAISRMGCNEATTTFVLAVLAGDDMLMPDYRSDAFRATGVAHILAISGMHLGIIIALFSTLLLTVKLLPGGRYIFYVTVTVIAGLYALITGMSPSTARAFIMFAVFAVCALVQRAPSVYNSVCVSVAVWLLVNPMWLYSPGMQLSVAAVLSIVFLGNRLNRISYKQRWLYTLVALVTVPIAALTGTSLLTVCYFHALPLWFIPVNIVAGLTVPVIIAVSVFAVLLVTVFGNCPPFVAWILDTLYSWLDGTVTFFSSLPHAQLTGLYPAAWHIAVMLAGLGLLIAARRTRGYALVAAGCLCMLVPVVAMAADRPDYGDEIYVNVCEDETQIMLHHNGQCIIISDNAPGRQTDNEYREYLQRRGCPAFIHAPDTFSIGPFARRGNVLTAGKNILVIAGRSDSIPTPFVPDYLIIGNRFSGDVVKAASSSLSRHVILAASLNRRRQERYERELRQAGIPVTAIVDKAMSIPLE